MSATFRFLTALLLIANAEAQPHLAAHTHANGSVCTQQDKPTTGQTAPGSSSPTVQEGQQDPQGNTSNGAGTQTGSGASPAANGATGTNTNPQAGADPREAMWPAATEEEWARPCLITWQRSYEDALGVCRETGKPMLICINMDGEIASEHYAGIRYRQPDIAKLYDPYVCVIASVYRHNPRDYDDEGRRIPCPRFGGVTCGEHIAIEPGLYDKFLDGRRIAPRHIMVELDGQETYDVYHAFDTQSVFQSIEEGITTRPQQARPPIARGDRPLGDRIASAHSADKQAVENAYRSGDTNQRKMILTESHKAAGQVNVDLLRIAVFGLDVEMSELARKALALSESPKAIDLIVEALGVPMPAAEREALIAALERLGKDSARAKTLAVAQRGLDGSSGSVSIERWSQALRQRETQSPAGGSADAQKRSAIAPLDSQLDYKTQASVAQPANPQARLELAEAYLALVVDPSTAVSLSADRANARTFERLLFEDARSAVQEAERLGAEGWRVHAAFAISSYYLEQYDSAYERAEKAVASLSPETSLAEIESQGLEPSLAQSLTKSMDWNAMACMAIFAEGRREAIYAAVKAKQDWPGEWLSDVHSCYSVLAQHPAGTDAQVVAHVDFLHYLGAHRKAVEALESGLERFPDSWDLHERLRNRMLWRRGPNGLENFYTGMLGAENASPNLPWFAGYASLVAAEYHRRASASEKAQRSYSRAIAHYESALEQNPDSTGSCDHYIALAHAGRARLAFDAEDDRRAVDELLLSFERRPEAADSLDGLNFSAITTSKMLLSRLEREGQDQLANELQSALARLDPAVFERPEFDRPTQD